MTFSKRKPAADEAGRLPKSFAVAAETARKRSQALVQIQARELRASEIPASRRAYALHRAYPSLRTVDIATRLAHDHGLYDRRRKPYRCKRLRRMIDSYAQCVHAGHRARARNDILERVRR